MKNINVTALTVIYEEVIMTHNCVKFSDSSFDSSIYKTRHLQMFFKIVVLKNFVNFTGKQLCWSLFLAKVFSCEICEIFNNTFFYRTPPVAGSEFIY